MFTLPSQPTTGVLASKEAGLELTSPARSRKNARNFTNRMAHSLLTAVTFVHYLQNRHVLIKGQRLHELHPCQHAPPLSCILASCSPSPKHAAKPARSMPPHRRTNACSPGSDFGVELQEEARYKSTAQLRWLGSSCY